jgi:hypothetical protein
MTTPFPFVAGQVLTAAQLNDIQNLPISDKTASYTLLVGDVTKRTIMNSASATTITVDDSIFTVGDVIQVANKGAGTCTITAGAGVTINSASGLALVTSQSGQLVALSASSFLLLLSDSPSATKIAIFNETQASGTAGGTFTQGSFLKRTLNTTVVNDIAGCTLTSSVISLLAGTYLANAIAPAIQVGQNKIRLQNTTAGTTIALGQNVFSDASDAVTTSSSLFTQFTLTTTSNIELQHRCGVTVASFGFGGANSFAGVDEIYSIIQITKIA